MPTTVRMMRALSFICSHKGKFPSHVVSKAIEHHGALYIEGVDPLMYIGDLLDAIRVGVTEPGEREIYKLAESMNPLEGVAVKH